jgi:hypothetical protein
MSMKPIFFAAIITIALPGCSLLLSEDSDSDTVADAGVNSSTDATDTDGAQDGAAEAGQDTTEDTGECPGNCVAPAPLCDGDAVLTYSSPVQNAADCSCTFSTALSDCGAGETCENGACLNPCQTFTCPDPSPPRCDDNTLVVFEAACTVRDGSPVCEQLPMSTECTDGQVCDVDLGCTAPCDQNTPCLDGQTCDAERGQCVYLCTVIGCPAEVCSEGNRAVYLGTGTCNDTSGECSYDGDPTDYPCTDGCSGGRCLEMCAGETCAPNAYCGDPGGDNEGCAYWACEGDDTSPCDDGISESRWTCVNALCELACDPQLGGADCPPNSLGVTPPCHDSLRYCDY